MGSQAPRVALSFALLLIGALGSAPGCSKVPKSSTTSKQSPIPGAKSESTLEPALLDSPNQKPKDLGPEAPVEAPKAVTQASATPSTGKSQATIRPASPNNNPFSPPDVVPGCYEKLKAEGVHYKKASLPVHRHKSGDFECGAPQALRYRQGPGKIRLKGSPILSCPMALAMARFEVIAQALAQKFLKRPIVRINHAGTYNCRQMKAYPGWVSEHSYANALDIKSFVLRGGQSLEVARDYQQNNPKGRFFRALARQLVDEGVFQVVLTPNFDGLHRRHLHLDMARYQVDGT